VSSKAFFKAKQFAARFFRAVFFRGPDEDAPDTELDAPPGAELVDAFARVQNLNGLARGYVVAAARVFRLAPTRVLVLTAPPQEFALVAPAPVRVLVPALPPLLVPEARTQVLRSTVGLLVDGRVRVQTLSRERIQNL